MESLRKVRAAGQVRAFTGNSYLQDLAAGNIVACEAWSGDIAAADKKNLKFVVPEEGAMIWADNMLVPNLSTHLGNAEKWIKFLSQPSVASAFAKDATEVPATELGADAAQVMGPTLADMTKTFEGGTAETTYDPSDNSFRAATYDQDSMGVVLADLTPLKQKSVTDTAADLAKLNKSFWATSK